ncbi:MAG: SDR family oxidoreductase, partial [Allorhizobium sp.]
MNKIAWITGSSTGIGRALAERLLRDGYRIAVSARSVDALASLSASHPGKVGVYPLDVTDPAAVKHTYAAIESEMGPVDLAVFAAGSYTRDYADDFDS